MSPFTDLAKCQTVIENLLRKNDKITFCFIPRQATIIHTSLTLVRFEILAKTNYKESKETLDIMKEIIMILEGRLKEKKK